VGLLTTPALFPGASVAEAFPKCPRQHPDDVLARSTSGVVAALKTKRPSPQIAAVPVDPMKLLAWIAERERDFPGSPLTGSMLMQDTAGFAGDDGLPWEAVAKAAARPRKRGHLDWEYLRLANESRDPLSEELDQRNFERTTKSPKEASAAQSHSARLACECQRLDRRSP
jgi:hypothetical protein